MIANIHQRLQVAEDEFLLSASCGPTALKAFAQSWQQLQTEVEAWLHDEDLLVLASTTASRILILASQFMESERTFEEITSQMNKELDEVFTQLSLTEIPEVTPSGICHLPPYVQPSYNWLIKHLHNPYPPKHTRNDISLTTGCPRKDIDNWFMEIRKRIGWTSLRKQRFNNCRSDIIDAATRFFIESDPKRPLDPGINVAFANIQTTASSLYSEKFDPTPFVSQIDSSLKNPIPNMEVAVTRQEKDDRMKKDHLTIASELTSPSFKGVIEDDEENSLPGNKRNRSRSSARDTTATKRPRPNAEFLVKASLPHQPTPDDQEPSVHVPLATKRKRRLSETDISSTRPKRPRNSVVGLRPNVVSNPFPMTAEAVVDEWLKLGESSFGIPDITPDTINSSEHLDISIFDFSAMLPAYTHSPSSDNSLISTPTTPEQLLPSTNVNLPLQSTENFSFNSGSQYLQAGIDDVCYLAPFEYGQDDFSLADLSTIACLPTQLPPHPSSLAEFSLLQPDPPTLWSWLTPVETSMSPLDLTNVF